MNDVDFVSRHSHMKYEFRDSPGSREIGIRKKK